MRCLDLLMSGTESRFSHYSRQIAAYRSCYTACQSPSAAGN